MRKTLFIGILAVALSGCATTGPITPGGISETAKQIQQYTRTFCAFVPTVQTIVSIINTGAGSALGIARDICAAITTAPLAEGGTRNIKVRGVPVRGNFVK